MGDTTINEKTSLLGSGKSQQNEYKLYRKRWYMLAVVALFNFSNAVVSTIYILLQYYAFS